MILGTVNIAEELIWSVGVQIGSDDNVWHDYGLRNAERAFGEDDTAMVPRHRGSAPIILHLAWSRNFISSSTTSEWS